jgi:hypothetical protein
LKNCRNSLWAADDFTFAETIFFVALTHRDSFLSFITNCQTLAAFSAAPR